MIFMIRSPVSPSPTPPDPGGGGDSSQAASQAAGSDEEDVDLKHVLHDGNNLGQEIVLRDEHGPGAREAVPMRSPRAM